MIAKMASDTAVQLVFGIILQVTFLGAISRIVLFDKQHPIVSSVTQSTNTWASQGCICRPPYYFAVAETVLSRVSRDNYITKVITTISKCVEGNSMFFSKKQKHSVF